MKRDLLTPVWRSPTERPAIMSSREWEDLLGQARRARLIGRLARHMADRGWLSDVPLRARRKLEAALRLAERQQREVLWETACLVRALRGVDGPLVLLKGAAYCVAGLPPRAGRLFADIDIMVARDRLADVEGALLAAGWISQERDAYNQRYYREWMHEIPPLRHVQRGTVVDVHHTVTPPTSRFRVDGAALLRSIVPLVAQPGLFVLSPADMVLHSAVHLFQEGEFDHGLRDLLDLDDLLRHFDAVDPNFWTTMIDRAETLGLGEPLSQALDHIEERFGSRVPSTHLVRMQGLRPHPLRSRIGAALFRLALNPHHPSSDLRWSEAARFLLYVRSHLLRMPLRLALPHLLRKAYMRRVEDNPKTVARPPPMAKARSADGRRAGRPA